MAFYSLLSIDHLPSNFQPTPYTSIPPINPPPLTQPPTRTDTHPIIDLEAAHLSSPSHELERPPTYMEQDMDEPLPTYMEAVRRKLRHAVQYPAAKMPSKRGRTCVALVFVVMLVLLVVIPIAATRGRGFNNTNGTIN